MPDSPPPNLLDRWNTLLVWLAEHGVELAIAAAAGIVLVALLLGARALACRLLGGKEATGWRHVAEHMVSRTRGLFIAIAALRLVTLPLDLAENTHATLGILFVIAAALQGAVWARAFIIGSLERRIGAHDDHGTLGTAIGLIRVLVTVAAFLIAIIVILDNVGVNVTGLIAGLGVGGIAIGLAAQGIFKDLFAALSIIFDRPFRRGDTVAIGGISGFTGTVEDIGLRTVRLRALDGEMVAIGNDKILQDRIHNFAQRFRRRVVLPIKVLPATKPDLLAQAPDTLRELVDAAPHAQFDRAHLVKIEPDAATIELVFYVDTGDMVTFLDARHAIILAILRRFGDLGIHIATPPTEIEVKAGA